jgi:hypothetical protein
MKRIVYIGVVFLLFPILYGFSQTETGRIQNTEEQIPVNLSVSITPGEFWKTKMKIFIFSKWKTPQLAVWLEDGDGQYMQTLMVTGSTAEQRWTAAPKEGRPESLPVWYFASGRAAGAEVDAVTGATPEGTVTAESDAVSLYRGREYVLYLEVNTSFDYNEYWPEKVKKGEPSWSGVNGQPSAVYMARFIAGEKTAVQFTPAGQGAVDGSTGTITPGNEGLTTALHIIESARADIR